MKDPTEPKAVTSGTPLLSPQLAFVLQLHPGADIAHKHLTGRIEHVQSGEAIQFESLDAILQFLECILARLDPTPREKRSCKR